MKMIRPKDVDEYIAAFPEETQKLLNQIRVTVKKAAPKSVEAISYGMPTFKLNGSLVYFAAYKFHIGFYPTSSGIKAYEKEISKYKWSKGTLHFPIDKPIPLSLITKIVKCRVKENQAKVAKKE